MTKDELIDVLKKYHDKKIVLALAEQLCRDNEKLIWLIDICHHSKQEVGFRAAWVLEHTLLFSETAFMANLPYFVNSYLRQKNNSCKRHYTKILMYLTESARVGSLEGTELEPLIEKTFEWLIDAETPVAVQVNCMDILYNLRTYSDWMGEELGLQIELLMREGSPAILARGKKLLQKLNRGK